MDQKLIDKDGTWITNTGNYGFCDPTTGTVYESGVAYKAKLTDWVLTQPIFKAYDPETGEVSELKAPDKTPAAPVLVAKP